VPMDEALVRTVVDLSGRSFFVCHMGGHKGNVGDFNMEHCKHFFRSLTDNLQMNCHIEVISGDDTHHVIEAVFKSAAKALRQAVQITGKAIPSTKGSL
jgi:imidazoleglycerol phosphate dehydratase HisB